MLDLARARKDDVFFDLGCGWAQNLIIAATEFGVKKCIGFESNESRYRKAKERVDAWYRKRRSLSNRIDMIHGDLEELFEGEYKGENLKEATIVLYTLDTGDSILKRLSRTLAKGCRLVYYYHCLFPEIKPDRVNYPFFVSRVAFKKPVSELDWLRSIVQKRTSSIVPGARPTVDELWDELSHDYRIQGLGNVNKTVQEYKRRLRRSLRSKG